MEAYVVTLFNWTSISGHPKDKCHNDIGLGAQIMDIILGSIIQIIERAYVISYRKKSIFNLASEYNFTSRL